jgi:hypothetical protein
MPSIGVRLLAARNGWPASWGVVQEGFGDTVSKANCGRRDQSLPACRQPRHLRGIDPSAAPLVVVERRRILDLPVKPTAQIRDSA